jgi:DNA invertase Pin-like site-specific DNA recombinase
LVIARLDRLSRNAAFIFTLKDSGVHLVCADMPDVNSLTIGLFAVLAQHERELIL